MRYHARQVGLLTFTAAIGMTVGAGARAASITAVTTGSPVTFNLNNESETVTVAGFNPALGTLTAITITDYGAEELNVSATNISSSPQAYMNVSGNGTLTLTTSGPSAFDITQNFSAPAASGVVPGNSTVPVTHSGPVAISGSETLSSPPTNLVQYIGASTTYLVTLTDTASVSGTCSNPVFCGTSVTGSVGITVTYNYSPAVVVPPPVTTPEPGSVALLGSAMAGLSVLRRHRKG